MSIKLRLVIALAAATAVASIVTPVGGAATVKLDESVRAVDGVVFVTLRYDAAPDERNRVTINMIDPFGGFGGWIVTETGVGVTLTAGDGCVSLDPQTVKCASAVTEAELLVAIFPDDFDTEYPIGGEDDYASAAGACGHGESQTLPCEANVFAWSGNDVLIGADGGAGGAVIGGTGDDWLYAGKLGTSLRGGGGDDHLIGAGGPDRLEGRGGDDYLWGRAGNDYIIGTSGADQIHAGYGRDRVEAGKGRDLIYARDGRRDSIIGGPGIEPCTCRWVRHPLVGRALLLRSEAETLAEGRPRG